MKTDLISDATQNTFRSCVYKNGEDRDFNLVALGRRILANGGALSFDERYTQEGWTNPDPYGTPFKEISKVPPAEIICEEYRKALCEPCEPFAGSLTEYAAALKAAIVNYLENELDTSRPTLVCHSAGYDSRIMSMCMREMAKDGFDFGEIHFRCHQPENELFLQIMKKQGWKAEEYSVWDGPAEDHYDLGREDDPLNGWLPYMMQFRFWHDIVPPSEEKKWNIILGLGGGELFDYPSRNMKLFNSYRRSGNPFINRWLNHFLYAHEWPSALHDRFNNCLTPFFGYEYLELAAQCPKKFLTLIQVTPTKTTDAVRHAILNQFDLYLWDIGYGIHDYKWGITAKRKKQMVTAWKSSQFREDYGHLVGDPDFFTKLNSHGARIWGFMTVYDAISAGGE